jgi:hypothetical protein
VLAALEQALWDHELVKVKLASEDRETRKEQAEALASGTGPSWPRSWGAPSCSTSRTRTSPASSSDCPNRRGALRQDAR